MTQKGPNRRQFLATTVAGTGIASTAGCLGLLGGGGSEDAEPTDTETDSTDTTTDTETETDAETEAETETEVDANGEETTTEAEDTSASVDEYLADTDNYDGTVEDYTGDDDIDVMVGAEGNGPGAQAFDPVAIEVSPGTLVRWVWTGDGGRHKVVHEGGEFESGMTGASGVTYEHTFDEPGTYLYYCEAHAEQVDMRGVVVVTES